jgi:prepilin-type N-terminal cleavage/methylation domain-containing protein
MANTKKEDLPKNTGFTLIELLVTIGIIAILAGVVLVGMSGYRSNARATKALTSLLSVVPSMASCWSFGGYVYSPENPNQGGNICSLNPSYGKWPDLSSIEYEYSYMEGNFVDDPTSFLPAKFQPRQIKDSPFGLLISTANAMALIKPYLSKTNGWYFSASNNSDQKKICCNSIMNGCKIIKYTDTCNNNVN